MPPLLGQRDNPRIDEGTVCTILRDGLECPNTETNAVEPLHLRHPDAFLLQVHLEATLGESCDLGTDSTEVLGLTTGGFSVSRSGSGSSDLASTRQRLGPVHPPGRVGSPVHLHYLTAAAARKDSSMPGIIGASKESTDLLNEGQPNCEPTSPLQPLPEHGFGDTGTATNIGAGCSSRTIVRPPDKPLIPYEDQTYRKVHRPSGSRDGYLCGARMLLAGTIGLACGAACGSSQPLQHILVFSTPHQRPTAPFWTRAIHPTSCSSLGGGASH